MSAMNHQDSGLPPLFVKRHKRDGFEEEILEYSTFRKTPKYPYQNVTTLRISKQQTPFDKSTSKPHACKDTR